MDINNRSGRIILKRIMRLPLQILNFVIASKIKERFLGNTKMKSKDITPIKFIKKKDDARQNGMKFEFDCGGGNLLTYIFDRKPLSDQYKFKHYFITWILVVLIFYFIPLIYCSLTQPSLWGKLDTLHMPFFRDYAVQITQLVLTPLLIINIPMERRLLNKSLNELFMGPVEGRDKGFAAEINAFYKKMNIYALIIGLIFSIVITVLWSTRFLHGSGNSTIGWQEYGSLPGNASFNFIGYYCAILLVGFYWVLLSTSVIRYFFHYLVFRKITNNFKINVIPFHPDKCGGLSMVSDLVRLNQPIVLVVGLVIATNYTSDLLQNISMMIGIVLLSISAIMLPLLPYRKSMKDSKKDLLSRIGKYFETLWKEEIQKLEEEKLKDININEIQELMVLYDYANRMPIWPYNWGTIKKFLSFSLIPLITMVVSTIVELIFGNAISKLFV
jgi:hypothetical protein